MAIAGTTGEAIVAVVEENFLARKYLLQVLAQDGRLRLKALEELAHLRGAEKERLIFVIDEIGLSSPLSECLRRLRVLYPKAMFLLLNKQCSKSEADRLLWLGVNGIVKHADIDYELTRAIAGLRAGQTWFPPGALSAHLERLKSISAATRGRSRLTQREHDVLELVKRRFSNREIGDALGIKETTVKFHVGNIFVKLNAACRRDLTGGTEGVASRLAVPDAAGEPGA